MWSWEDSICASVPSSQFEFLPYTRNVAVRNDSLRSEFHIYYMLICNKRGTNALNKPFLIFKKLEVRFPFTTFNIDLRLKYLHQLKLLNFNQTLCLFKLKEKTHKTHILTRLFYYAQQSNIFRFILPFNFFVKSFIYCVEAILEYLYWKGYLDTKYFVTIVPPLALSILFILIS